MSQICIHFPDTFGSHLYNSQTKAARDLEHDARLRVLYEIRGWIEPEIRMLEQILDRPISGRE
jgi:hypothetical protein